MAEADDLYVGRYLLEKKKIKREDIISAVQFIIQARQQDRPAPPLGVMLVRRSQLDTKELISILAQRSPAKAELSETQQEDTDIGSLFVLAEVATTEQVRECLAIQRASKTPGQPPPRLGDLLIQKGYCNASQVKRILTYHNESMYICVGCTQHFSLKNPDPNRTYKCPNCQVPLMREQMAVQRPGSGAYKAVPRNTLVRRREEARDTRPKRAPEDQAERDRAVALYLKSKNVVRPADLEVGVRLQQELQEYGIVEPLVDLLERLEALSWQQLEQLRKMDFSKTVRKSGWLKQAIPGYHVTGKMTQTTMATLFHAKPAVGGAEAVLKILHKDRSSDDASVKRFNNEARLLRRLDHAGIVKASDNGEHQGVHYIVLEKIQGKTMATLAGGGRGVGLKVALFLVDQAAEALKYLHNEGYLHRDVKPEGIVVDMDYKLKLCDLGFAAPVGAAGGSPTMVGSANYMSPEQAKGETDLKAGTDIFSLGLVFFFLLTGRHLYPATAPEKVFQRRFAQDEFPPEVKRLRVPGAVRDLLTRMIEPDRSMRLGTWAEASQLIKGIRKKLH